MAAGGAFDPVGPVALVLAALALLLIVEGIRSLAAARTAAVEASAPARAPAGAER
jgi:hypothetical protein